MSLRLGAVLRTIAFIALALALCGVIFELAGYSALLMFEAIVEGAFLRAGGWAQSLRWALPLFITATGVAISFRCGFFNIGAQGQFYIGAISAAFVADLLGDAPAAVVLPASFLAGTAGGALWAFWPGYLRLRSGTDEVITTLMGNFIATLVLIYVTSGPLKDPSGTGQQAASPLLCRRSTGSAIPRASRPPSSASPRPSRSPCGCWSTARPSACWQASPGATRPWCGFRARGSGLSASPAS